MTPRRGSLLLRGMRWRLGASLLTVLASTIAVATAVLGPLYLHAAGDSVLRRAVAMAPVRATGLTLPDYTGQGDLYAHVLGAVAIVRRLDARPAFWDPPIVTVIASGSATTRRPDHTAYGFNVISRTGVCADVHVIAGTCDLGDDDGVIDGRSARRLGVTVGDLVDVGRISVRITGITALPNLSAPYWWGEAQGEFLYGQAIHHVPQLDPVFVSPATALAASGPNQSVAAELPLRAGAVGLSDEAALKRTQARIIAAVRTEGIIGSTSLPAVLQGADQQRAQLTTIVAVAAVQLVILAVWVLAGLIIRSADARQSEARVARLRGLPTSSLLWATAAEPGLLCAVGAVVGVALAWVAVVIARASLLERSATIAFDGWTVAALALTVVAIVGALAIGAVRVLRSTQLSRSASTAARTSAVLAAVVDVVLVVLALAAVTALATTGALSGHTDPLAAAAPGLIALAAAVLAVRLVLLGCRLGISVSGDSRRLAPFLALRQTGRRPGTLRQARVLVIALGLSCFAVAAWSIARTNRASAADFQVGARTVVSVVTRSPSALEQSVDRADPSGRWAMGVARIQTPSSTLLAVDASRLAAVASWPPGISSHPIGQLSRVIDPPTAAEIDVPDGSLEVSATAGGLDAAALRRTELAVWVFTSAGGTAIVDLGTLAPGERTYAAALSYSCEGGCRVAGLGIAPKPGLAPPGSGTISLTVTGMRAASHPIAADLSAGGWRSGATGVSAAVAGGALTMRVPVAAIAAEQDGSGAVTPPMALPDDHPAHLPVVATDELEAINAGVVSNTIDAEGLDGDTLVVRPVESVSALPSVGADAALVDLDLLDRSQVQPTSPYTGEQVWIGPHAPRDAIARLRAAGLVPSSVGRASAVFTGLQRTGPALADDFLLVAAIAALLVAAASTLGALGATTRERATELASLRVAGVARATLARSLMLESTILLVTALSGAVAGTVAAALAVPSLPERVSASLAPLRYTLPVGSLAIVTVAVLLSVGLVAAAVATILMQRMSPALLRTAPDDVSQ